MYVNVNDYIINNFLNVVNRTLASVKSKRNKQKKKFFLWKKTALIQQVVLSNSNSCNVTLGHCFLVWQIDILSG